MIKEIDDGDGGLIKKRSYVWYERVAEGGARFRGRAGRTGFGAEAACRNRGIQQGEER